MRGNSSTSRADTWYLLIKQAGAQPRLLSFFGLLQSRCFVYAKNKRAHGYDDKDRNIVQEWADAHGADFNKLQVCVVSPFDLKQDLDELGMGSSYAAINKKLEQLADDEGVLILIRKGARGRARLYAVKPIELLDDNGGETCDPMLYE